MTDRNHSEETAVVETNQQEHLSACSLVLTAVHIPHTILTEGKTFIIYVSREDAENARYHLFSYQSENVNWPPPQPQFSEQNSSAIQPPTFIVIGALVLFYNVTGPWNLRSDWFSYGAGDSTAILQHGEYYRIITALTLHADLTHLLGDCFLGGFLLHFFCKTVGPGIGVFAVLLSAALGNYINVYLHGPGHHFVGYSTAVFATIGMLAMASYHSKKSVSNLQILVPVMAGAALLAMTGSSGERTDLGAHFFGILSGFFIGRLLITEPVIKLRKSSLLQLVLFLLTAFIVYFSWEIGMQRVY